MRRAAPALFVALALLLTACKVDASVQVEVAADGSGTVTVVATADADVVTQAPGLADDLRFDDAVAAGWEVDGPTATDAGGLTVTLSHPFSSVSEATALLQSINGGSGRLHGITITLDATDEEVRTHLTGILRIDGGIQAFADPDLLAAVGGSPYADDIAATGLRPSDVVSFTFAADLPGSVETTGTEVEPTLTWAVPLDGTSLDVGVVSVLRQGEGSGAWGTVADLALVALVAWCLFAAAFIAFVAVARRRRARRRAAVRR